jgi:hypothetical protein
LPRTGLKADGRGWRRYDRIRADVSEGVALAAVSRAVGTPVTYPNLSYYAPRQGQSVTALGAASPSPQAVGDQTECDGLFVIGDVAICVEVKGRTVAGPARRGDRARLATEIKKIFGEGPARRSGLNSSSHTTTGCGWVRARGSTSLQSAKYGQSSSAWTISGRSPSRWATWSGPAWWGKGACPGSLRFTTLR